MNTSMIRLLFIEDNPADALLVREMLDAAQHMGWHLPRCEIKHVVRLQEGLDCLENETFDVVLSDLDLPDSRAGETVTTLREHIPRMPLVVLTGREDEVLAHQSVRAGVQDYLYKDEATGSVLVRSLMYAIERQQAHAELEQRVEERTADLRQTNEELQAEITEHKRTEDALRESEERYRRLVELSPDLIAIHLEGKVLYINEAGANLLDISDPAKVIGKSITEFVTPARRDVSDARMQRLVKEGQQSPVYEQMIVRPDGTERDVEVVGIPFTHQDGTAVQIIAHDVTARKQAEERMEHLNRVLRTISNVNQLIIKETDRGRLIQGVCDKLTETRGYHNAWIALLEDAGESVTAFESGLGADFAALREQLQRGELNACGQQALSQSEVVATEDPASTCTDCPLAASYAGRGAMTVRLEHDGDVYGLLTVSVPAHFTMDEEERSLFQEVAGDVAFALHGIELEKKRKQAEEALRESEERYRTLIQNIHAGVVVHGADSQIITCNRKAQELLGLTENQILGAEASDPAWRFLREDGTPMRLAEYPVNQVLNTRQPLRDLILGMIWPGENDVTWNTVSADPIFDAAGDITEVIVSFMDITARKRAADALQASESRFRSLFENSPIAYQSLNEDGRYIDVNHRLCELLGYSRDELMGKKFGEFWSECTQHRFPEAFEGFKCSGAVTGELELVHKDGSLLTVVLEGRTQRDLDGNFVRTHCILHNITARKQTEEALRESEERFSTLFAASPDAILLAEAETGVISHANAAAAALFEYPLGHLVGMPYQALHPAHQSEQAQAAFTHRPPRPDDDAPPVEIDIVTTQGETKIVEIRGRDIQIRDKAYVLGNFRDITERKRAEVALRESKALLAKAEQMAHLGSWEWDVETGMFTMSEGWQRVHGCDSRQLTSETLLLIAHPDDRARIEQALDQALKGQQPYDIEHRIIRQDDGEVRTIQAYGEVIRNTHGTPIKMYGAAQDITARKRAEDALRRVRYSIDRVIDSVFWVDENGNFIDVNDAACRNLGYKREELLAMGVSDIDPNFPREAWSTHWKEMLRCGTLVVDSIHQTKSGRPFPVEVIVHNQQFGDTRYNCVIARDITERKQMEDALRESERRHRKLAANIPGAVYQFRMGPDGTFTVPYMSAGGAEVFERPLADLMSDARLFDDIHPEDREAFLQSIDHAAQTMQRWSHEFRTITPTGKAKWLRGSANPRRLPDGSLLWDGVLLDVTGRKRAEEGLRESEQRFRTIVNALPQFIAYNDADLIYRFVNQAYQEKFDVEPEEVLGKSLPEVIGEEAFEEARPHVERALQGEQVRYHERFDYAIGGTRDIDGILVPDIAADGEVRGYYAVLTDITPYMEMQEELRQSTERLHIQHDIDTAILRAQSSEEIAVAALERLHHLILCRHVSIAEIDYTQHRSRDMIILVDGDVQDHPSAWHPMSDVGPQLLEDIQQGHTFLVDDIAALEAPSPLEQKLANVGIQSYVSVPLMAQEAPVGTLNLGSESPDFFQPSHIQILEESAASLAVALQQARLLEQTRRDAETKALLLREVNHRVKNNLNAIIGLLYIERRHAPPEALPAYRPIMENLTRRITGLSEVHQMLSGGEWEPLNLGQLAERIIQVTVRGARDNVDVAFDVSPTSVYVQPAQAQHLALILSELTTNTLKHAVAGRGAVHITVRITQQDGVITLTYRNDGPGYAEEVLSLKRHSAGLDIVKRSVRKNLRGELTLRNEGGAVTEIRFKKEE